MSYSKKTWTNRQSEYPNRRRLTATGTAEVYEVAREEGLVVEEGDPFDQASIGELDNRVSGAFGELVEGTIKVGKAVVADSADAVAWGNISGKPTTFPPQAHTHTKANITDFPTSMPPTAHTHTKANITDFPTSLPANGGNADTVDGFHIAGIGTSAPGSLANNALFFVYE
ncbi:MAG: hypothetical protein RSF82_12520 [Angelakisella sp.]